MQARRFVQSVRTGLTLMAAAGLVASGVARAGDQDGLGAPAPTTMTLQKRREPLDDPSGRTVCGIPRTGQTSCWNENSDYPIYCPGTGQDGEYQVGVGVQPRFTDNGDGTVRDNLTGLIWLKDSTCLGSKNWIAALADANALADGECGLRDGSAAGNWRMPNIRELLGLIDYERATPAFPDGHPFSGWPEQLRFWSSTSYRTYPERAWVVQWADGNVYIHHKPDLRDAWAVRGGGELVWPQRRALSADSDTPALCGVAATGQTTCWDADGAPIDCAGTGQDGENRVGVWVEPRFADNADGTVTDHLTGLIWLKDATCLGSEDWMTALADANALRDGDCGLTDGSATGDWRLPNIRELHSLIDFARGADDNSALPAGHPFTVSESSYWSSTSYRPYPLAAWLVYAPAGDVIPGDKLNFRQVWAVRDGR